MSFPYTLTKKMVFNKSDFWISDLPSNFHQLFMDTLKNVGYVYEEETFTSSHSLFSIPFKFDVKSVFEDENLIIKYQLHLQNLVNWIIVILLLSAFISRFEFGTFLFFSLVTSVLFFQLSLLIINTGIKKQINQILAAYRKVKEESDIEYWVKESDRNCPACGAKLDNHTLFCNDCGLKIRQNAYSKPLNLGKPDTQNINKEVEKDKTHFGTKPEIKYHYLNKDREKN